MLELKNLFERITTVPKVRSINGVFIAIDNTLEETYYDPPYQRNYVWDDEKATFFIETILLGSEVPPIILFKSSTEDGFIHYEVIDGRQRYQTILRFLNGDLKLKKGGLQKLGDTDDFAGKTFTDLSLKYQSLFKDTKIRTIEYSFVGPYSKDEEELLKREIFQRYNSGISPLKSFELDRAKYFHNDFNQSIKQLLSEDEYLDSMVTNLFMWDKLNIDKKVAKIRELLVLHRIPIQYYANKKQTIVSKYFEYISSQIEEDAEDILASFCQKIEKLQVLKKRITEAGINYNRLYAECLFWVMSVMDQNQVAYDLSNESTVSSLIRYLKIHFSEFTTIRSSFYSVLLGRYKCIAKFFEDEYRCSFKSAIENNLTFKETNKSLSRIKSSSENTIENKSFEQLRINKPEPTSVELTELLSNLKSNCFTIRPPYQRGDVKNKKKSSAIIESMLLGVMLPPIFVFKRKNGNSEVIDGQQRLLSIISYIGESYKDENGEDQKPLLHNFKLDLGTSAVLKDLKGKGYKELTKLEQNKIRKTSIFIIEIKEEQNPEFDPVDLFVRLNNKPYPIPKDSFEMWNSFAPRKIIQLIKDATKANEKWFYFRKNNTRMDNETIFTTLAYFQYMSDRYGIKCGSCVPEKTIEVYTTDNRVACRFRNRSDITHLLYNEGNDGFIYASNKIEFNFVLNLRSVLSDLDSNQDLNKGLDSLLSVENGKRTQMSFYILWILLHDMPSMTLRQRNKEAFIGIRKIFNFIDSCNDVKNFIKAVDEFRNQFGYPSGSMTCPVSGVTKIYDKSDCQIIECIKLPRKPGIDYHFYARKSDFVEKDSDVLYLGVNRAGIRQRYVEAFLRSRLFSYYYKLNKEQILSALNYRYAMPLVSMDNQMLVAKTLDYVDNSYSLSNDYFQRLLDIVFYELAFDGEFKQNGIKVLDVVKTLPSLNDIEKKARPDKVLEIYSQLTDTNHILGMYLLKVIDVEIVREIEMS